MRWQEMFLLGGMWTCEAAWGSTVSPRLAQAAGVAKLLRSTSQPFDIFIPRPDLAKARFLRLRIMPQMNAIINVTRRDKLKNGKLVFIIARVAYSHFSRQRRAALTVHPATLCVGFWLLI